MLNFSCTTPNYNRLYARFLTKPDKILKIAKYDPKVDIHFMDLCGGTGAVSKAAIDMGAPNSVLVDINPRVDREYNGKRIYSEIASAENFNLSEDHPYDLIVCRQAINYLNIDKTFKNVYKHLADNGRFIFNTFEKPKRFIKREYCINAISYKEYAMRIFNRVFHIQIAQKLGFEIQYDFTLFKYIPSGTIVNALIKADFREINIVRDAENSIYYICRKSKLC